MEEGNNMKFEIGQLVATSGIADAMNDNIFTQEVNKAFTRYRNRDWGELEKDDAQMNDLALINEDDRILAKYETSKGAIYIITEWDRSVTTILFANEY